MRPRNLRHAIKPWPVALLGWAIWGCDPGLWPERRAAVVDGVHVDSLDFAPVGTRFAAQGAGTRVLFRGIRKGFLCSAVLKMDLQADASGTRFAPYVQARLPEDAGCPLDVSGSDSGLTYTFPSAGSGWLRLTGSGGAVTDSAWSFRGRMEYDSLEGVPDSSGLLTAGRWRYLDSSSAGPTLSAVALDACEALNQAVVSRRGDSVRVLLTRAVLDPDASAGPDSCRVGPAPRDSIRVWPQ